MADSFEIRAVAKTVNVEDAEELRAWVFEVAIELEKRALESMDLKARVFEGNVFIDLPTSDPSVVGALYVDAGTVKVSL